VDEKLDQHQQPEREHAADAWIKEPLMRALDQAATAVPRSGAGAKAVGEARPDERDLDIPGAERTAVTDFGAQLSP
jgi:hypothetical protein